METESSNTKKIIIGAVLAALLGFAVYFFFFRSAEIAIVLDEFGNPVVAQVVGKDLIDLLKELQAITLDDAIFATPAFLQLVDSSVLLSPQPQGRENPFAPISGSPRPSKGIDKTSR